MHVHVDTATSNGIGAVLYQEVNGEQHPLLFQSRRLTAAEQNYSPTDAELCGVYWAVTKAFHSIIQYSEIVIHTDHLNLKDHLNLGKATTKRRQRWCYYLGDYNIVDVIHEKGATFTDCDTLSRLQIIPQAPSTKIEDFVGAIRDVATEPQRDISFALIRREQAADDFCTQMTSILNGSGQAASNHEAHMADRMVIENGILQYVDIIKRRDERKKIIVAPESLKDKIYDAYHNQSAGHRGAHMTALAIRSTWWWPRMMDHIKRKVSVCTTCETAKATGNSVNQGTRSTMQPSTPHQILTIDLYNVADLEITAQGEPKVALTAIYNFTRYPVIVPLADKKPATVAKALEKIFVDHGTPAILHHDQGKEFEGPVNSICKCLGIENMKTAPRSPNSTGIIERLNESLGIELRRLRQQHPNTPWTDFINTILLKLRTTQNASTHHTPYELVGLTAPQPKGAAPKLDAIDPASFGDKQPDDNQWSLWTQELAKKRTAALANDIQARDARLERMNAKRAPIALKEGDWVRICTPSATKMAQQVSEPHKIVQVLDSGRKFIVENGKTGKAIQASISKLIKSREDTAEDTAAMQPEKTLQIGPKAALVLHKSGRTQQYKLVEWTSEARNRGKAKVYINTRPSQHPTQHMWTLKQTAINIKELKVIGTFDFEVKKGRLIVPLQFRRQHNEANILGKR